LLGVFVTDYPLGIEKPKVEFGSTITLGTLISRDRV